LLCIFFVLYFVSSFPSLLLCHSIYFFNFHVLIASFLLHLLIFVYLVLILSLYLDFGYNIDPFCVFIFCLYFTQFIVVEKVNGSLSYTMWSM
jgi:hypothetical protein